MDSVTKKLPLLLSIFTALSLTCVVVHHSGIINKLKQELSLTQSDLSKTKTLLKEEMDLNEEKTAEIRLLKDSINVLHAEIAVLHKKITGQKQTIRQQDLKMKKLSAEVNELSKKISRLTDENTAKAQSIKKLEIQRNDILTQMEQIDRERTGLKKQVSQLEQVVADNKVRKQELENTTSRLKDDKPSAGPANPALKRKPATEEPVAPPTMNATATKPLKYNRQEQMNRIVTGTTVKFSSITLRNKENGKAISRIKSDEWKYTMLRFDLKNAHIDALIGEEFIIQLYDMDNEMVVPFNELNQQFPESSQGAIGVRFTYEGKPLSIDYFNTQKKTGDNYEIRLFYARKGYIIPVKNGRIQIVESGNVVAG